MTTVKMIAEEIKTTVAPIMDRWVDDRVAQIVNLKAEIAAVKDNEEFKEKYEAARARDRYCSMSNFRFYWFERRGVTKGDYLLATYEGAAYIREKMVKEAAAKLKKIDVAVAKKVNFSVDSVEKLYFKTTGKDGFVEGAWKLNGEKVFSFETFYAGGYNIQCFHVRTKYKLK